MQEERDESNDNSVAVSAAFTDASSQHHSADTDDAQSIREETREQVKTETGNSNTGNGRGYEGLDARGVEEARLRAQQPSVYASLHADNLEDLYSRPKKKRWIP